MRVIFMLFLTALLFGCDKAGDEFIGKWIDTKDSNIVLEIERGDSGFVVRRTAPSAWNGKTETRNIPASFANGVLTVQAGLGSITLSLDASGKMVDGKREYSLVQ
jgi:hypothetical protein